MTALRPGFIRAGSDAVWQVGDTFCTRGQTFRVDALYRRGPDYVDYRVTPIEVPALPARYLVTYGPALWQKWASKVWAFFLCARNCL